MPGQVTAKVLQGTRCSPCLTPHCDLPHPRRACFCIFYTPCAHMQLCCGEGSRNKSARNRRQHLAALCLSGPPNQHCGCGRSWWHGMLVGNLAQLRWVDQAMSILWREEHISSMLECLQPLCLVETAHLPAPDSVLSEILGDTHPIYLPSSLMAPSWLPCGSKKQVTNTNRC